MRRSARLLAAIGIIGLALPAAADGSPGRAAPSDDEGAAAPNGAAGDGAPNGAAGDGAPNGAAGGDAPSGEAASPDWRADGRHVDVRLVTDAKAARPGEQLRVGLLFDLDPKWHIYWHHSGDSGLPTEIGFHGPDGVRFDEIDWPVPTRFETDSGLRGYGYEDEVLIHTTATVPADTLEGSEVELTAHADWLVCQENCIQGKARLTRTMPVRSSAEPSEWAARFDEASKRVPRDAPRNVEVESFRSVDGVRPDEPWEIVFRLTPGDGGALTDASFYPAPLEGLEIGEVRVLDDSPFVSDDGLLVRVHGRTSADTELDGDRLDGVVQAQPKGGEEDIFSVRMDLPRRDEDEARSDSESPLFDVGGGDARAEASADGSPEDAGASASGPPGTDGSGDPPSAAASMPDTTGTGSSHGLPLLLLFAFVGGLILNIMPCVLPVLSIKVMSLIKQSREDRRTIAFHGVSYTVGILLSFAVLGVVVIALKASGQLVGWGFQFQQPTFVAAMGAIVFVFGLSLFGVFEVQLPGSDQLGAAASNRGGYVGSFMNGVLATILATPCSAPFLAPALAFALTQPPTVLMVFLLTIGLGLASPFLLLAGFPQWSNLMPKPGGWMNTFRTAMGFLLVATTVWLVDVLAQQVPREAVTGYLAFLAALGLAAWIYGHWGGLERQLRTRWIAAAVAVFVTGASATMLVDLEGGPPAEASSAPRAEASSGSDETDGHVANGEIHWQDFMELDVTELAAKGKTVFIDFTAAWCMTCKANEQQVIDTSTVREAFRDKCVVPVKADYTNENPRITRWLERFQRPGVPMYIILPADAPNDPILLPESLSKTAVLDGLTKAGPSNGERCRS